MPPKLAEVQGCKYVIASAPTLVRLSREACDVFLRDYARYSKERNADKFPLLKRVECVDERLLEILKIQQSDVVASEEAFEKFLKGKCHYDDVSDLISTFKALTMDMNIADIDERLLEYDFQFLSITKLATESSSLSDQKTMELYVEGIRPLAVQRAVAARCDVKGVTLQSLMKIAGELACQHEMWFKCTTKEETDPKTPANAHQWRERKPQAEDCRPADPAQASNTPSSPSNSIQNSPHQFTVSLHPSLIPTMFASVFDSTSYPGLSSIPHRMI